LEPGTNHLLRTLSIAVHEFRTPVTVVAGYLRMLLREQGGPLTDKQRKMLEETERSCGRLSALVNEMSELVKLDSHALTIARQDVDVAELVAGLAGDVREGSDRGVGLEVRANGPLVIAGDRPRLSAALTALMHAAVRERGEPGTIVIDVTRTARGRSSPSAMPRRSSGCGMPVPRVLNMTSGRPASAWPCRWRGAPSRRTGGRSGPTRCLDRAPRPG
jgi:signal transduction histidine kinase